MASPLGPDTVVALRPGGEAFLGVRRPLQPLAPAAGAEWTLTLEGGAWWRILFGSARLVTSAAVANRIPALEIADPDGNPWAQFGGQLAVTASLTHRITYAPGIFTGGQLAAGIQAVEIADVLLEPGWRVRSLTSGIDVADQYSQVRLFAEEVDIGRYAERVGVTPYMSALLEGAG